MFIFAIFSIPSLFVILEKEITSKKIVLFVWGVIISSIISLIMWSAGTLYHFHSDTIIFKSVKLFIVQIIPTIILFYYIIYTYWSKRSIKNVSSAFVYGFLYWNLLFSLGLDMRIYSNLNIILLPIVSFVLVYIYHLSNGITFKKNDKTIKSLIMATIPLYQFAILVLSVISNIFSILLLIILIMLLLMVRINLFKIKEKILIL